MADSTIQSVQQEIQANSTPEQLGKIGVYSSNFSLIALDTNSDPIYIGGFENNGVGEDEELDDTNGYPLVPGAALPFDILNMDSLYLYGTATDKVAVLRLGR